MANKRYNLFAAICLIIGICVGSGIFFKADNVLIATGGSVALGVLLFIIAAIYIVFGGLALSVFASKSDSAGGITDYATQFVSANLGRLISWYYTIVYLPCISAVLFFVTANYLESLLGLTPNLTRELYFAFGFLSFSFVLNALSPKLSQLFQNASTLIKMAPLVLIAILGLATYFTGSNSTLTQSASNISGSSWLLASAPIAFSYDGWHIAISIAPELKNAHKNLPRALIIAPLLILLVYIAYFLGISAILSPATVMSAQDQSLSLVFTSFFGDQAAKAPLILAFIAIFATGNGVVTGLIRLPQALASRGDLPQRLKLAHTNPRFDMPLRSAAFAYLISLMFLGFHYFIQSRSLIYNGDIAEVAVSLNMFFLTPLFFSLIRLGLRREAPFFRACIASALALTFLFFLGATGLFDFSRLVVAGLFLLALGCMQVVYLRQKAQIQEEPSSS